MIWRKKKTIIPIRIVELEDNGIHIVCQNTKEPDLWWIIDTGASSSVVDRNYAERVEITYGNSLLVLKGLTEETMNSEHGYLKEIDLGNDIFYHVRVAVMMLDHIQQIYDENTDLKICGIIGCDFLTAQEAVIDLHKQNIIIQKHNVKH
ncbi:aspartyl protease family protein [Prolixibacteraceae bacterium]|nr:aspartyl protease family protein [Prolixibacteraceae bacterium]